MDYIDKIVQMRKEKKITQQNIADTLHITQQQYWAYEKKKNELPIRYLTEICKILDTTPNHLLGFAEE